MLQKATIGILGGMGPEATHKLCQDIFTCTPAKKDQDHIPLLTYNNPTIPDRTEAILYGGDNPVPELVKTGKRLEAMGADFLLMPCNTAHFFIEDIQSQLDIPILNMVEETVLFMRKHYPDTKKIGLLATSGTIHSKVYEKPFRQHGIKVITPDKVTQENVVMQAIYGERGIKAKYKRAPQAALKEAAEGLLQRGAEIIIAGCTEISLVLKQHQLNFVVLDPSKILAEAAVRKALAQPVQELVQESIQ